MGSPLEAQRGSFVDLSAAVSPLRARFVDSSTAQITRTQESHESGKLVLQDIQQIIPILFSQNPQEFLTTVSTISGKTTLLTDIKEVTATSLQFGRKAQILRFDVVKTDKKPFSFVTYISRGASNETLPHARMLADEAREDARNLTLLAEESNEKLNLEGRSRFKIVKPIAEGEVSYEGKTYPFFTMPLIPARELHISWTKDQRPFMQYALNSLKDLMPEIRHKILNLGRRREVRTWENQQREILTMLSLVYLLEKRLPREFLVNAGDIMGEIQASGLKNLSLITVRGGFTEELTEEQYVSWVLDHTEEITDARTGKLLGKFHMFENMSREEIINHLVSVKNTLFSPQSVLVDSHVSSTS
jgi:hypothetical protein